MKQKDSMKNLIFGLTNFTITTLLGIIIPRLFLLSYGSEVNGLINSVKQIFAYFALLEAGVGGATLQALYAPVAKKDKKEISSILAATTSFYKKTGVLYGIAVIVLACIYPMVVKTDISPIVIICIILFQGEAGVVKYLVTAKLQLLMRVDGKNYILVNFSLIFGIFSNFARIILIYTGFGVLWVQGVFCMVDICQVVFILWYAKKNYSWLDRKALPNFKVLEQKNSVLLHQISGLIFNNTDTIILTFFCGLKTVSVYAMYAMLFGMVANIIGTISSSVNFAMGQLFHSDKKKYDDIQETYETYYLAVSFALFTIAYLFILPFLKLYTNGVKDINYIDDRLAILFLIVQILNYGRNTSNNIIDYAGHFKQTQWRSLLETGINITVSLFCVSKWGIYGVLVGTIVALFYRTNDIIIYANYRIMRRSAIHTYRRWGRNIILLIICSLVGKVLPRQYNSYFHIIAIAAIVGSIIVVIFVGVNTILEKKARKIAFNYIMPWIERYKRKIKMMHGQ